ncbi:MAG: fibronectin type III domain-containing protein [Chitinispirillaceae bacterium]|nr:fibronectin type III domain-containing protein [Chitinispirillaceae bacterium]
MSSAPNAVEDLYQLETPTQFSDYYGQRIRGYIIPPANGEYTFWIASDDRSQLWLSTDADPVNKQKIAYVDGYCSYQQWAKYPATQKSGVKNLTAGVRYYFEVLHKDGSQNDNLSVGWSKPGQSTSTPSEIVPGSVLSPYTPPTIPNDPTALSALPLSATQIDLTWTDNSDNELGFRIERALGADDFQLVYTTAASATVYHDGGLSANTQYRYRVQAYNGEGNSGYTNTVTETTLAQSTTPPPHDLALNSFGLYSSVKTELRDQCIFNGGGAIGSNTSVELLPQSIINGSVVCGGDILLRSQAEVMENATAAGTVTLEAGAIVHGEITEGATVATITIPEKADIETGTEDVTVNIDQDYGPLAPGLYKQLWVGDRGTITLTAGRYTFTQLFLSTDTKIELDIQTGDVVEVEVAGDLEFSDRSQVTFLDEGYIPFVRFYTNDDNTVRIGCDVQLNGMLTAPYGDVHIYSRAQCNGAIYARIITIEPEAVVNSGSVINQCGDSDGDHIQDIIEVVMGTDPNDATSFIPIAIPSEACIDNSEEVIVSYDFSYYFPDYTFANEMEATFPAGALARSFIPLIPQITNLPRSGNPYTDTTTNRLGRYISFTNHNWLTEDAEFSFQLPYNSGASKTTYDPYQDDGTGAYQPAPVASEQIYSKTASLSSTNSLLFVGERKTGSKTLYFPGGYVYSNSNQAVFLAVLHIKQTGGVTGIRMSTEYTDYSGGTPVTGRLFEDDLELEDGVFHLGKKYRKADHIRINKIDLVLERPGEPDHTCSFPIGTNAFPISGGQCGYMAMVHSPEKGFTRTADDLLKTPSNWNLLEIGYYPDDVTFESVNLGEGRMVADLSGQGDQTTFEYFLTDHLGSTRMALNEDEVITEAVMYTPYGMMSDVPGASTAALPVREKFTTKEFDEEGGTGSGTDGLNLFYFGARFYDPEVGVWIGSDEQFWNSYMYCSADPISHHDPNGRLDPISHLIQGGWNEMMGDFYREDFNPILHRNCFTKDPHFQDKIRLTRIMHSEFNSVEDVEKFFSEHTRDEYGLTEAQWRGYKKHAYDDMLHEAGSEDQMYSSPYELIIWTIDTRNEANCEATSIALAGYQDVSGTIVAGGPAVMLAGLFLTTIFPATGTTLLTIGGGATPVSGVLSPDYIFSQTTHLLQNAVHDIKQNGFWPEAGGAFLNETKQTTIEFVAMPTVVLDPTGISQTVFTVRSVTQHIRHWFLQD